MALFCKCNEKHQELAIKFAQLETHIISLRNMVNRKMGLIDAKSADSSEQLTTEQKEFLLSLPESERQSLINRGNI